MEMSSGIADIQSELQRVFAPQFKVVLDSEFEPAAGTLLKIEYDGAHWHMIPQDFRNLLAELPTGAGPAALKTAIEAKANPVWHGPQPEGSRDTPA
jgi:hypothetical protein